MMDFDAFEVWAVAHPWTAAIFTVLAVAILIGRLS